MIFWATFTNGVDRFTINDAQLPAAMRDAMRQRGAASANAVAPGAAATTTTTTTVATFVDMDSDRLRGALNYFRNCGRTAVDEALEMDLQQFVSSPPDDGDVMAVRVGDCTFHTTRTTLKRAPFFDALLRLYDDGRPMPNVDRDATLFAHVLSHLRNALATPFTAVAAVAPHELDYYGLMPAVAPRTATVESTTTHRNARFCAELAHTMAAALPATSWPFDPFVSLPTVTFFASTYQRYTCHERNTIVLAPTARRGDVVTFEAPEAAWRGAKADLLEALYLTFESYTPVAHLSEVFDTVCVEFSHCRTRSARSHDADDDAPDTALDTADDDAEDAQDVITESPNAYTPSAAEAEPNYAQRAYDAIAPPNVAPAHLVADAWGADAASSEHDDNDDDDDDDDDDKYMADNSPVRHSGDGGSGVEGGSGVGGDDVQTLRFSQSADFVEAHGELRQFPAMLTHQSADRFYVSVPLRFYFCDNTSKAFPLLYGARPTVRVTNTRFADTMRVSASVFELSEDERRSFLKMALNEALIDDAHHFVHAPMPVEHTAITCAKPHILRYLLFVVRDANTRERIVCALRGTVTIGDRAFPIDPHVNQMNQYRHFGGHTHVQSGSRMPTPSEIGRMHRHTQPRAVDNVFDAKRVQAAYNPLLWLVSFATHSVTANQPSGYEFVGVGERITLDLQCDRSDVVVDGWMGTYNVVCYNHASRGLCTYIANEHDEEFILP